MYKYTHFIPQNIAPSGAKRIGVYNDKGEKIHSIYLGGLTPVAKERRYSFGLVADIHLLHLPANDNPNQKFDNALSFFENYGCLSCIVCGDLTRTGFYLKIHDSDATEIPYLDEQQMAKYKEICDSHSIPVYALSGNHECYYGKSLTDNLDKWEMYTGKKELSYAIEQGDDLFILLGQPNSASVMSDDDLQWLYEMLENNRNKRCFIFVHAYIEEDSGDPLDYRENSIFEHWGASRKTVFMNLLKHYKNTILFHGHSHTKYECQRFDKTANYTEKNGFKSVHVPSTSTPRDLNFETGTTQNDDAGSQGCVVDVYRDCIVLNGIDLINKKYIPLGVYKIDTTLQTVEAGTFVDSTGTIKN